MPALAERPRPAVIAASSAARSLPVRAALPWLVLSLGLTMAPLAAQVPAWTLLIFAGCAAWRLLLERRNRPLPNLAMRLAVFLPSAAGVYLTYGRHPGAPGMLAFLLALLALKVLELRSPRDVTIVALLGYFMILAAFFYDQSLTLSLYLALAILANTVGLLRCHGAGNARPWRSTLGLVAGLGLQSVPLMVLLFVIFPRVQGTFLRGLGGATTGLTGMSEHLEPGSFSALVQSESPAFRASIRNGGSSALAGRELYWRGVVLDVCDKPMSWRGSSSTLLAGTREAAASGPAGTRIEQQITLMPHGHQWLFALDRPVNALASSSVRPQLMSTYVLRNASPIIAKTIYTAYSQLAPTSSPFISPERHEQFTRVPADQLSPRVRELVAGWRKNAHSDEEIVQAARRYFHEGGYSYTLNPGKLPPKTALDYFLFRSRRGFCEHYAAAFATLMRAADIPARIVIGYQGGEFNAWGDYYTIRQSDAHAWAEVWIKDKGWRREDPTAVVAPERLSFGARNFAALSAYGPMSAQSRLDTLSALNGQGGWRWLARNALLAWDSMDQRWNVAVLGYDQDQQSSFMQSIGLGNVDWFGGTALALAGIFSMLGIGALILRGFNRAGSGGGRSAEDRARALYARFCKRLAAAAPAARRAAAEGPLDFAARARSALPAHAGEIDAITSRYIASRYAPAGPASEGALGELKRAVNGFRPMKSKA